MCGIAGFFSSNDTLNKDALNAMADAMTHRGPDAGGFFVEDSVGLAHRRLSIIDLSESANQPMFSRCGRYAVVFNGEIYNYRHLRDELVRDYCTEFRTNSDTEVITEGFARWGTALFGKMCGMFAIALYDRSEKTLWLCRDRLGIKPLYLYQTGNTLAFASELKSLTAVPAIKQNLHYDQQALSLYLHLGYIPQPHTIYSAVSKFPAGSWACIKNGHITYNTFWNVWETLSPEVMSSEEEAFEQLQSMLRTVMKEHLICDVPYGAFLSGGIDSSLVSAMAAEAAGAGLHTFSVGFDEAQHDESAFAERVASHLGTTHHTLKVTYKEAIELIPQLTGIYDEPYADSSAVPTCLISALTRKHVTMALSGDGGDELFMGYGAYNWAQRLANPFLKALRQPAAALLSAGGSRSRRAAHMLGGKHGFGLKSHIFSQEQYLFTRAQTALLLQKPAKNSFGILDIVKAAPRKLSPAEQQALFDMEFYLKDDLLVKVDRASMQHALEVRVPLLDHRLVEFAVNLNENLRLKGVTTKYLLKKLLYTYVPADFFARPKKGFSIPLASWMQNELKPYIYDNLSEQVIKTHGMVEPAYVNRLLKSFESPKNTYLYNRIWALAVLHDFLSKNR